MYDKLRTHVNELFSSAPKTRKVNELKDEILANLIARYNHFLKNGKSETEAFNNAISEIGNADELINSLLDDTMVEDFKKWRQKNNDKHILLKSITSIFWPIIVAIYLLINFIFDIWSYSWIIFIIAVAVLNIIKLIFNLKDN